MNRNFVGMLSMSFIGTDNWGMLVYKCIETDILYKGDDDDDGHPKVLYSCGNDIDGDPCSPISSDYEIQFTAPLDRPTRQERFNYQMLSRLISDCEYFLNNGHANVSRLYCQDVKEQIEKMRQIYDGFEDSKKPEWINHEKISQYEIEMTLKAQ